MRKDYFPMTPHAGQRARKHLSGTRVIPAREVKEGSGFSCCHKTPASTNVPGPETPEFNCLQCPHSRGSDEARKLVPFQSSSNPPGIFVVSAQQMGVGMGGWDLLFLVTESWNLKGTTHTCPFPQQRTSPSLLLLLPLCGFGA